MMPGEVTLRRPWAIGLLALAARVEAANMRDAQARGNADEERKRKTIVDDYEGAIAELMACPQCCAGAQQQRCRRGTAGLERRGSRQPDWWSRARIARVCRAS
jgi:hypothetical protein